MMSNECSKAREHIIYLLPLTHIYHWLTVKIHVYSIYYFRKCVLYNVYCITYIVKLFYAYYEIFFCNKQAIFVNLQRLIPTFI